jgi:hypothetical protein
MNVHNEDRIKQLLKKALPPADSDAEPSRDLWPAVLRRLDAQPAAAPWYDWALLAGIAVLTVCFPAAIPLLLYYL